MNLLVHTQIQKQIYCIRGYKVMLDSDLAELYKVTTFNLNKAVQRNHDRFPDDFMFQLTVAEYKTLIFQIGISNKGRGGRRHMPYVFTQEGVSMLSSVLRSPRAIQVNIAIMRAFVHLRELLHTHKDLTRKLKELEKRYDKNFRVVFEAIRELMSPTNASPMVHIRGFKKD